MKRFEKLSPSDKEQALKHARVQVIEAMIDSPELFDKPVYDKIMLADNKMKIAGTPWFISEAIYEVLHDEVDEMAVSLAKDAYYPDPNDVVFNLCA